MASLKPQATKAYLVLIDGITAYFSRCSAPEETLEANEYTEPSKGYNYRHYSFTGYSTVTLGKMYDPAADGALIDWMNQRFTDRTRFSISITPVNPDTEGTPIPGARTLILTECQLIRRRLPEADRSASGLSMIEIEVDPRSFSFQ